jgi:hypothetical protein
MNLFDMIFRNALAKEVVFSSVYNYLLEKSETHGMGSLVFDRILTSLPNSDLADEVRRKFTEWDEVQPEFDFGPRVGRVDSMLNLRSSAGDRSLWFVTEVKIVDASAKNTTADGAQLGRYLAAITAAKVEEFLFVYLVPSAASRRSVDEFSKLLGGLDAQQRRRCFVLFWKDGGADGISLPKENLCTMSFDRILQGILSDEAEGLVPPISTEIRYVLKSIIQTIRQDFNRSVDVYEPGRFPDRTTYLANLSNSHRELYEHLEELFSGRRKVSPGNTSVGFPYTDRPLRGEYNTLFRVLTMTAYRKTVDEITTEHYAYQLIIECDEQVYGNHKFWDSVADKFTGMAEVKQDQKHPDAAGTKRAIWIVFDADLEQSRLTQAKEAIEMLVDGLSSEFETWQQSS